MSKMMVNDKIMAKLVALTTVIMIGNTALSWAQNPEDEVGSSTSWAETRSHGKEQKTLLKFYFHDVVTGESPTTIQVVKSPGNGNSFAAFGSIAMADDPLTVGPDPNSNLVGRAQGLYGFASQQDLSLIMGLSYTFIEGVYNGSSVTIFGRNPIQQTVREFPVVGGTGLFRMARGYAIARTYSANVTTHNAIVGYNITIFHY